MRIIGGHDYYDSAASAGIDKDIVWIRHKCGEQTVVRDDLPDLIAVCGNCTVNSYDNRGKKIWPVKQHLHVRINPIHLVVCGIIYFGMYVEIEQNAGQPFWDGDKLIEFLKSNNCSIDNGYSWNRTFNVDEQYVRQNFGKPIVNKVVQQWMIENKITLMFNNYWEISNNHRSTWAYPYQKLTRWQVDTDGLDRLQFAKIIDPYTLFQEISMYVGGILTSPNKPTVQITDEKVLVSKHGFDKWSFRKQGTKKC